jgi:hypothetical protein
VASDGRCADWRHLVEQDRCAVGNQVAAGAPRDQVDQQPVQPVDGLGTHPPQVLAPLGQQVQHRRLILNAHLP